MYEPLNINILPRRLLCSDALFNAKRSQSLRETPTVESITIAYDVAEFRPSLECALNSRSYAATVSAIDTAFATFKERSIAGLLVGADAFFSSQRAHVVAQAALYGWPSIYQWREFAEAGGFASYGPSLFDGYRQTGLYAARVLKGERPADLPVQQPTKFEFVINLKAAKAFGRTVPLPLLGRADEVIE